MEIELKLELDPSDVPAFRSHPLLKTHATGKPEQKQLTSIYFDTHDFYFWKHQSAIRVRKEGRNWTQTFKAGGQVESGLHQRNEWESDVAGPHPDLDKLIEQAGRDTPWVKLLSAPGLADVLKPAFTTQFRRTAWILHLEPATEIELALDQGTVEHGELQTPICEIELELKSGDPAALFDFALQMQKDVPLRVSNTSKAERGYALHAPHQSQPVKATRLELPKGANVEQGFEAVAYNCLAQVQANEIAVRQGDAEGVHQMRVGLRRLRSALRLFEEAIPFPDDLQAELRWLASELGGARDWHVFADETLASVIDDHPDMKTLLQLKEAASDMAKQNEHEASDAINSLRYSRLLLMLGAWMKGKRWRESPDEDRRKILSEDIGKLADKALARTRRKLLKRGKLLQKGTSTERHKARIAAKRARYSAEFFRSLYPEKKLRRYIGALEDLQELLGEYHDWVAAGELLEQASQLRTDLSLACGFVQGCLAERIRQWWPAVEKPWAKFSTLSSPTTK